MNQIPEEWQLPYPHRICDGSGIDFFCLVICIWYFMQAAKNQKRGLRESIKRAHHAARLPAIWSPS